MVVSRSRDSIVVLVLGASLAACGSDAGKGSDGGTEDATELDAGISDLDSGTLIITLDAATRTTVVHGQCAAADMLVVAPREANVGHSIHLDAAGIAPDLTRSDVVITWTAVGGAGSLAASTGDSNVFDCTSTGSSTITATASIGDGGPSCENDGSLSVVVVCD
jgi:hypothetical protein